MVCKNCHEVVSGNYCASCGQSTNVGRISTSSVFSLISEGLFQVNKGLFFTILAIFKRPGHSIREFIEGKRKKYFKPAAYVMLLATIYVLCARFLGTPTFLEDAVRGFMSVVEDSEKEQRYLIIRPMVDWISGNVAYAIVTLIPFFSLATFIAFAKQRLNYFEHLVLNAYIAGHQSLFYILHLMIQAIFSISWEYFDVLPVLLSVGYRIWTYYQFFSTKKSVYTLAYTILAYFMFFLAIELFLLISIVISIVFL